MKNSLYIIAGLLMIIWAIVFFGFRTTGNIHLILAIVALLILVRIVFGKQLSGK